jgi:cytochrome b involved in lipid metabolism
MKALLALLILFTSTTPAYAAGSSGGSAPAPAPIASPTTTIALTKEEVSKHNKKSDCWSIVNGYVYNLTNWVDQHPGGASAITSLCGVDGTSNFLGKHGGSSSAKSRLKSYELGKLEVDSVSSPQPATAAPKSLNTQLEAVTKLLESKNFTQALSDLSTMDKDFPNNADINNLLGFASRNLMQYKQSASYYTKALRINPNHLGAIEYQGELFVKTKKIAAAKRNLAKLKRLCGVNCPEYLDLRKAIGKR